MKYLFLESCVDVLFPGYELCKLKLQYLWYMTVMAGLGKLSLNLATSSNI